MNIPKPSPRDLEILGRLESEYAVADRFSSGSVEAKHIRLIAHLHSQAETLTAERDQWKKQCESECQYGYLRQDELDAVKAELAALRSAPGIDEVDEILRDVNSSMFDNQERLASITRRAIASREEEKQRADEVAGLLKWWVSFKDGFGQLEGMSAGSAVEEWKDNARRILEIAEGE